jgi:energy-coupling factor transporter ATP-binding protein EcfA2
MIDLNVTGFRALRDVVLSICDETDVALVLGNNGTGKSSLAAAIEYALTGACEWTTAGGAGAGDLVLHGADRADIRLTIGDLDISRTIHAGDAANVLSVNGYTGKKAAGELELRLPPVDVLRCMLRSDALVSLKPNDQKSVLVQLAGGSVDAEWVKGHLTDEEIAALENELAVRLVGSELLDHLRTAAENQRREAGRIRDELAAKAKPGAAPEPAPAALTLEEMDRLNAELRKLDAQIAAKQKAIGASEEQAKARQSAQSRHSEANSRLDKLRNQRRDLGAMPKASAADLDAMRKAKAEAVDASKAAFESLATLAGQANGLEQGVEAFEALGAGKCVLGDLDCPLGQEQRQQAVEQGVERVAELRRQQAAANEQYTTLEAQIVSLGDQILQAEASITAANEHISKAEDLDQQIAEAERASEQAAEEYKGLTLTDTTRAEQDLAALKQSADAIHERFKADISAKKDAARQQDAVLAAQRAQEHWAMLETLVGKLKPSGLPAQAMRDHVGVVLEAVNRALFEFAPFEVSLDDEQGLCVSYLTGDEPHQSTRVPVKLLSESEKLRVGTAVQVAFAVCTDWPLIVVDATDRLDAKSRLPHLNMLRDCGVKALVLAVPLNGKRQTFDGVDVYDLEDGRLVEPGVAAEVAAQ